jgi:hypothetical protein
MESSDKSTSLMLRDPKDLNQALISRRNEAHLLTPYARTEFGSIARGFVPALRSTMIDSDPEHGEVYKSWERPGELALTKIALTKLGQLGGVVWVKSVRTDDRQDPYLAEFAAEGKVQDMDGTWHNAQATRTINLNDGTPEANKMKENELKKARQNISALAESKAKNRVLRELFGLQQSYKPDELKKPFVVLKLAPDMEDPEVRRLVQAQQLGLESFLFQPQEPHESPVPVLASGTSGLELPEPPGKADSNSAPVIDIQPEDVLQETPREKCIKRIEALYYTKTQTGVRDPGKPKLMELDNNSLDALCKLLESKPDFRKPAEDLV